MKKSKCLALSLYVCFLGIVSVSAQETVSETTAEKSIIFTIDKSTIKVQQHTIMERFEPEMVISVKERLQKKLNRATDTEVKICILDTLDVSAHKKNKLFLDLKYAPYSERLHKATLAEIQVDDETVDYH